MPNMKIQKTITGTPLFSGLELMERVNAMYQSNFINSEKRNELTTLIREGMNTGDYTELNDVIVEQRRCESRENPFWTQMTKILEDGEI